MPAILIPAHESPPDHGPGSAIEPSCSGRLSCPGTAPGYVTNQVVNLSGRSGDLGRSFGSPTIHRLLASTSALTRSPDCGQPVVGRGRHPRTARPRAVGVQLRVVGRPRAPGVGTPPLTLAITASRQAAEGAEYRPGLASTWLGCRLLQAATWKDTRPHQPRRLREPCSAWIR